MDMTALSLTFNMVSDRAAEIAVAALWQGLLVGGALALLLRFMPRISAAYRFAAWAAAFVALVCLTFFSLVPDFATGATRPQADFVANKPWIVFDARWSLVIAGLWLAISLYRVADLAIHSLRLRRLWKDASPVHLDERVEALMAGVAVDCCRGPVEVCTTTTLQRPSVIGFFRPRILIPDWLFARLTQGELEQIMLHEAEHLRRRDDWTNLAQKLCLVLFSLNPALLWIERRLCREREMACDEGVVRVTRAPRAYAACLASMAERGLERRVEALSLGAWQRRPELVHRVHSILRSKGMLSPAGARVLLGSLGCGLLVGSVALGRSPQLVAFVPESSSVAASEAKNLDPALNPAMTAQIQTASVEPVKVRSRIAHAAPSRPPVAIESPLATYVTLREPSTASAITLKSPAPREASELLVFTAWEQVETTGDDAVLNSDYDTEPPNATKDAPASRNQQPSGRVTVTQLIFKVSPSSSASGSATKPSVNPSTSQPGFAVFRDGWLVIQL